MGLQRAKNSLIKNFLGWVDDVMKRVRVMRTFEVLICEISARIDQQHKLWGRCTFIGIGTGQLKSIGFPEFSRYERKLWQSFKKQKN